MAMGISQERLMCLVTSVVLSIPALSAQDADTTNVTATDSNAQSGNRTFSSVFDGYSTATNASTEEQYDVTSVSPVNDTDIGSFLGPGLVTANGEAATNSTNVNAQVSPPALNTSGIRDDVTTGHPVNETNTSHAETEVFITGPPDLTSAAEVVTTPRTGSNQTSVTKVTERSDYSTASSDVTSKGSQDLWLSSSTVDTGGNVTTHGSSQEHDADPTLNATTVWIGNYTEADTENWISDKTGKSWNDALMTNDLTTVDRSKGNKGDTGLIGSPGDQGLVPAGQQCGECPAGPPGPVGPAGEPGGAGPPGAPGQQGEPGFNGTDGRSGRRGRKGPGGMTGLPGAQGETGEPGPRGHKGDTGAVGPVGPSGADASTLNCTCEKGQKGDGGDKGKRGLIGFIGYKGEPGDPGPNGPPGPIMEGHPGPPGLQGLPGPKGDKGDSGCSNQLLETTMEPTTTLEPTTMPATTVEPTIDDREKACRIRMVGKPLFQRYTGTYWGAWMRDPEPVDKDAANKYWFTRHFTGKLLYEYDNEAHFRQDRQPKVYELKELYFGTGHVIYAGAFYYHKAGHNEIVKFDLEKGHTVGRLALPEAAYQGMDYVYDTEYNYLDLAVDENGLWVIYAAEGRPQHLLVSKINADGLFIEKTWTIHVRHQAYGNGFITCGVLYLINSTKAKTTVIEFAYDLYTKTRDHNVRLKFTNPFQQNNMVSYNPKDGRIYSWDKGNQLTYPLLM